MVLHVSLCKFQPDVPADQVDMLMRRARSLLLRIPQVLSVRSGKKIDPDCEWPFFLAVEFESRDKQAIGLDDPHWLKFMHEVLGPHLAGELAMDYELEPGRNIKYS
jgi:hypothetical protein